MNDIDHKQWLKDGIGVIFRLLLAITFIWASIHKIAVPRDFALQVATYQILPLYLINVQAIILPWVEVICGGLLIVGLFTRGSALVTIGMNIMFIVAITMALLADLHLQCGCFSASDVGETMTVDLIVRDALLLLVGIYLTVAKPDRLTLDNIFLNLFSKKRGAQQHAS